MRRLEFRVMGITENDLREAQQREEGRQRRSRQDGTSGKTARAWLGGAHGLLVLAALAVAVIAGSRNWAGPAPAMVQTYAAQCAGQWRVPLDLSGKLYVLPDTTDSLPDYSRLPGVGTIAGVKKLQVRAREFFPAAINRSYSFGIDFRGQVWINASGDYLFTLTSDDGSLLYVDGQLLLDNNGTHAAYPKSLTLSLRRGWHSLRVPYFEGAGGSASLALEVCKAGKL